ncbi:ABC-type hemin transport system, ATPase component [gamma proteobacterium HdN1]|nr:ABC-type hemin transport system, ATPase component [gamma proteobacterium HdN1]
MLEVEGLGVRQGRRWLLRSASFKVQSGKIVMLVGPNGAGKSSLLKTLAGEWLPSEGSILLRGRSLANWSPTELALSRAVLPQQPSLGLPFSVREVAAFGRTPHATGREIDRQIVEHLLQLCDVQALAEVPYTQLSGGERQRVHWARVLAQLEGAQLEGVQLEGVQLHGTPAPLLLMDEPTSALDLSHQTGLMEALRVRANDGWAAVVAVHDLNLAARFGDQVLVLNHGRITAFGAPWQVFTSALLEEVFRVKAQIVPHPHGDYPLMVV